MKKQWIEDAYDKRKQRLLRGLVDAGLMRPFGVVPMATDADPWSDGDSQRYLSSLGVAGAFTVTTAVFRRSRSGHAGNYFADLASLPGETDLFLDPDSGLTEHTPGDRWRRWKESAHVSVMEVATLATPSRTGCVLVYDHTVAHSAAADAVQAHAESRVSAFEKLGTAAGAWFWERAGATAPLLIVCVSGSEDRIRRLRSAATSFGADGLVV